MSEHVLVIEPRKEIIEDLEDRLVSVNHTFDIVTSQVEARECLQKFKEDYSYVILSLSIPARPGRPPKMPYSYNLFKEIQQVFSDRLVPVILTLDRRSVNSSTAARMVRMGAFAAVKPFEYNNDCTLEDIIFTALDSNTSPDDIFDAEPECILNQDDIEDIQSEQSDHKVTVDNEGIVFVEPEYENEESNDSNPEMIFYDNRVELCGVSVCGDSSTLTRRLLDLFKERTSEGFYKAYSGYELAVIADCESGQQGISACVSKFRNKALDLLKGISVDLGEIIVNDRAHGYRLEDHIEVIDKIATKMKKNEENKFPPGLPGIQQEILNYLHVNKKASRAELQNKLKLSRHAINRQLQALRDIGLVKCIGQSKSALWLPVDSG